MTVKPMLGDWEIPRISMLRTVEQRKLKQHAIPGRIGNLFQDLGTEATEIRVAGSVFEEDERTDFLEAARQRFTDAEPMTFVADITAATEIQHVLIESLVVEEHATRPSELSFHMTLRESPPPPPPTDPFGALDSDLLDQAAGFVDSVTDALDAVAALGDIPDFQDPSALVGGATDEAAALVDGLGSIGASIQSLFGDG